MRMCKECGKNEATRNTDVCYICQRKANGRKNKARFVPNKINWVASPSDCPKASAHHWLISSPDGHGGAMPAVCKYCGARRTYSASVEDVPIRVDPKDLLDLDTILKI